ncbi:hypothetical protein GCM10010844_35180 [Deinococcus radiotolerans]|uniref:DUF3298 domain-containing protein n=2 Tax=Deinococcus radiotolerans TaxID=1309407 RepID=A0ABQ2FP74_9DEIO|nr:hypothetical protein GCM10010844_35180 [Deinococcus radiotolerans]
MLLSAGAQAASCGAAPGLPDWARGGTYRGTLGSLPVALSLDPKGESLYFYEGRSLDLLLEAGHAGNQLVLQESVRRTLGSDPVVTGCFTLMPSGTSLKGTWQAPGAQGPQEVVLTPLDATRLPLRLPLSPGLSVLRRDHPLTFLKLNRPWVTAADGRSVREPLSGVRYPRVPGASAALNAALQDRQLRHAADALDCRATLPEDAQRDPQEGYNANVQVTLLNARLLSLREDVDYYCGGAHPDNWTQGVILDRATGRAVPLTTLFPKLSAARQNTLYLNAARGAVDAECLTVLRETTLDFTAHLSAQGLNLTPSGLPHVVAACAETVTLPYAALRGDANLSSAYVRTLYVK